MLPAMRNSITYFVHGRNVEIPEEYVYLIFMKTRKELAAEYSISCRTLNRRIKEHHLVISRKRYLSIEDVLEVYLALRWPLQLRQNVVHTNSLTPNAAQI
jgi:hypothetical protein